jgi:hypothetical protein
LNIDITTKGCNNRVAIKKRRQILCIYFLCIELVVESVMELVGGGGNKEHTKVWKEREALG